MAQDTERKELAKLPSVTELEAEDRKRVMELMERLDTVLAQKLKLSVEEDSLKDELELIQKRSGKPGFRHGWLCFQIIPMPGRKTLDKMLLLENGCPVAALNNSYKTGKPYTQTLFRHLEEEA